MEKHEAQGADNQSVKDLQQRYESKPLRLLG